MLHVILIIKLHGILFQMTPSARLGEKHWGNLLNQYGSMSLLREHRSMHNTGSGNQLVEQTAEILKSALPEKDI